MPTNLLPNAAPADSAPLGDPQAVTEAFLASLAMPDVDAATALLADDVTYVNVGLPPLRGRQRVAKFLRGLERPGGGFEVYLHAISADGPVVLTERTDVILFCRIRAQFWVCGRFDVHDGRITLWRDSFDFLDIVRGTLRGLVGAIVPSLRPRAPTSLSDAPGR